MKAARQNEQKANAENPDLKAKLKEAACRSRNVQNEWMELFELLNRYLENCFSILRELIDMSPEERGQNRHKLYGVRKMLPGLMRDRRQVAERLQSMGYDMPCLR